jgi:hypothetical protein
MPIFSEITFKKMDVSIYNNLSQQIPDKFVVIKEIFPKNELEEIWRNYESHLSDLQIFPFLGTLGEAIICVGYGDRNKGKIFYFDFGGFELEGDKLEEFLGKLIAS